MYKEIIKLGEAATDSDRQEYLKQDQIGMGALWAESYLIARGYDLCLTDRPDQWEIATESLRYAIEAESLGKQELVDKVIDQMKSDIDSNDWTSIEGLLILIEPELLKGFLSD
jgi:hypothetical protein